MLIVGSQITITGEYSWRFKAVESVDIVEDINTLTDTCTITLPKKIKWEGYVNTNGEPPVQRGDQITVELGYDDKMTLRFYGYVRSVDAQTPVRLKCEDSMFLLKQKRLIPKSWKDATLYEVISYFLQRTNLDFHLMDNDIRLGKYRITKSTVAEELQALKEKYLLSSYFRLIDGKSTLYVGLKYPLDNRVLHEFKHAKNIISEEFEYRKKEDIRVKVEAVSFNSQHEKIEIELGDRDGEVIKIRIDGLTKKELEKYAKNALEKYKQSGFKGTFTSFGDPPVHKCDMVYVVASDGNKGTYLVKKNEISVSVTNGYRQKIELGYPVN